MPQPHVHHHPSSDLPDWPPRQPATVDEPIRLTLAPKPPQATSRAWEPVRALGYVVLASLVLSVLVYVIYWISICFMKPLEARAVGVVAPARVLAHPPAQADGVVGTPSGSGQPAQRVWA